MLFDLSDDPGETRNLVLDVDKENILSEHRDMLCDWLAETNDSFPMPAR